MGLGLELGLGLGGGPGAGLRVWAWGWGVGLGLGRGVASPQPAHLAPRLTPIVGNNLHQLVVVWLILVQVVFVHGLADHGRSLILAGYLDREGADRQGEGPGAAPSECSPRDLWSDLALHTKAQLLAAAGSMGASPPRPAPGGLHAGMGGLSQLFLPPNLVQACYLLPCHLGTLPAPGGRSPRARPCRTMGSMNPGKRQHLVPALEAREELARCPGAASVPGLHWLEAAVVVSTGQPIPP